jgi:hypothetical protein
MNTLERCAIAGSIFAIALACMPNANAAAASGPAALAKAEQAAKLAECKLENIRDHGLKTSSKEYFGFMFQCLTR